MPETEQWTGERAVWQNPREHLKEFQQCSNYYMEAMQYAIDRRVIDAACGSGFGSFLLSLVARSVSMYDINPPSIMLGLPYPPDTHVTKLDFETEALIEDADITVSIETIEHLENPDFFLSNLKAKALFFTIPCYGDKNPFHKIQYSEESAKALIIKYFPNLSYRMEKRRMIGYATK